MTEEERDDWSTISYSEAATLARCEMQWHYKYRLRHEDPGNKRTQLGTITHDGVKLLWEGATPDDIVKFLAPLRGAVDPEVLTTSQWLLERYGTHYADLIEQATIIAFEVKISTVIPGTTKLLKGRADQLFKLGGRTWAVERKTMADWRSLETLEVSPQPVLYDFGLKAAGHRVWGVMLDAIRTYRWKRDPHPPADSFKAVWTDYTVDQHDGAVGWLLSIVDRRAQLTSDSVLPLPGKTQTSRPLPVRNIGQTCNTCPFRVECWSDLKFPPEEQTIELA